MEQKRIGLPYVFTLAKEERGKLGLGMLLAVLSSALSLVPYMVVYQISVSYTHSDAADE